MWQQWVNAVLGLVAIALPFMGLSAAALTWSLVVGGIAVAVLSIWAATRESSREYHQYMLSHST
jgi:hypothetical protein